MFPIAWVVVEGENQASWTWFISLLMTDLRIIDGYGWTIISDQQKGLANAVAGFLPRAEHRNCARHIYSNWKKKGHSSDILRNLFWKAVKCTTREGFQRVIGQMETLKEASAQDFVEVGVQKFCRAFISEKPKCEVIDNNMSECFNSFILPSRSQPIIDMLEYIRRAVMERIVKKRELFSESADSLCPQIRRVLEDNRLKCRTCSVIHARILLPAFTLSEQTLLITSTNGSYLFPPLAKKQPGRPKRRRRIDASEARPSGVRLTKKGVQMHCSLCNQGGHNRKTCNNTRPQPAYEGSQFSSGGFSKLLKSMTKFQV
ncbi:uncharacterized protein LOC144709064 [Wolffia australiana]